MLYIQYVPRSKMASEEYRRDGPYYSMTIKVNGKGESSGEYTVRADTFEELQQRNIEVKDLFRRTID